MTKTYRKGTNKKFWDRTAAIYKKFTYSGTKARVAYDQMMKGICKYLAQNMVVLELAAGPGVLSYEIARRCKSLEATDFSEKMIAEAKKKQTSSNLHFSVQDATKLPYKAERFDAVVIANALHIMPDPDTALQNIHRVLKPQGLLLCPTFTRENGKHGIKERMMEVAGFRTYSRWNQTEFQEYIEQHGFTVLEAYEIYGHNFPITFLAAKKTNGKDSH